MRGNGEVVGVESLEDFHHDPIVLFGSLRVDEDVIYIDNDTFVQERAKNLLDKLLEDRWGVHEAEGHDKVLEMPVAASEGRLPLMLHVTLKYSVIIIVYKTYWVMYSRNSAKSC